MTTFAWQFTALEVLPAYQGLNDVVEAVHWRLVADDGNGHIAEVYGEQTAGPPDPQNFTPFDNLTATQVQGWVEDAMGAAGVNELQAVLIGQINEQINPTCVTLTPPWT